MIKKLVLPTLISATLCATEIKNLVIDSDTWCVLGYNGQITNKVDINYTTFEGESKVFLGAWAVIEDENDIKKLIGECK